MADIGAELQEIIRKRFMKAVNHDTIAQKYQWQIMSGTATMEQAQKYAARVGELLAEAISGELSAEVLPNGVLTEDIAGNILRWLLADDYDLVTDASAKTMESLNRAAGLHMKAVKPPINSDRVEGLIKKASSYDDLDKAKKALQDPVVNFSQNVCDRLVEENVNAHFKAGLSPKITRKAVGGCCKWCSSLEGTYDYPVPREIYRRHENCRCLVLYDPGDGKVQNAHTKKVYEDAKTAERESRIERAKEIEAQQNAMYHRRIGKRNREVIDQPTYNRLTRDYLRRGGTIERGPRAEEWLNRSGNGASYIMGGNHTFFREDATISEVLEEMYHAKQDRIGKFNNYPKDEIKLRREIEAQHYVMSLQKKYKIPELEMEELRTNLADYERDLEELLRRKHENS